MLTMRLAARYIQHALDVRGIERCILGGCSMGGYIAFEAWRLFPERIAGLILADTRALPDDDERRATRVRLAEQIGGGGYAEFVELQIRGSLCEQTRNERPDVVDAVRTLMYASQPESAAAALIGMSMRADSTPLLPTINVPTALIFGEHDSIVPQSERESLRNAIPESTLTILPDAGHLSNIEQPAAFNAAVMSLINRVQPSRSVAMSSVA
jgi:3-oxoadipate enol-lactonase